MKKFYILITALFISQLAPAKTLVRVNAIGASPRGQFVAFEEFGYQSGKSKPFSKIRVMNVWKNKYVDETIQVIGHESKETLSTVRQKAKAMALKNFVKFNISL